MIRALAASLTLLAIQAATAFGAAGGGSSGFGGGGGGGGGGGSGFGGGGAGSGGGGTLSGTGVVIILGGVAAIFAFGAVQERRKATWSRAYAKGRDAITASRRRARRERIEGTALVAAEDDPAFASELVRAEADALFRSVQDAWDRDDRAALAAMVAPDLLREWSLRLADFAAKGWHNHVAVRESAVEYVGITNRMDDSDDRVVVRVAAELDDYVTDRDGTRINHSGNTTGVSSLREYWTLGKREGRWTLLSIEQDEEGEYQLDAPMEADPADDARLTDTARVEAAVADALPAGTLPSEVDDDDAVTALAKARDLSLADGRYDPDIIEAAVRRGVAAWAEAVDGDDTAFAHLAQPALLEELLYPPSPGRSLRLVVRSPVVTSVTLVRLDTDASPPTATVRMGLEGVRYVEDRNTLATVAGSRTGSSRFDGTWTLALDGPPDAPWRICAVRDDLPG